MQLMSQGSEPPPCLSPLLTVPSLVSLQHRFQTSLLHLKESTKESHRLMLPLKVRSRSPKQGKPTWGRGYYILETSAYAGTGDVFGTWFTNVTDLLRRIFHGSTAMRS